MLWNRRRALLLPLLVGLVALGAATGCVEQPVIAVHHVEMPGAGAFGLNVTIWLQVRNPNSYDVQVRSVRCNVTFGRGTTLGPIEFSPNQWLRANQTTLVAVPVTIPWTLIPALASESSGAYSIPYQVHGVADVTATSSLNIERNNYPIHDGGFVSRQMVMDIARRTIPLPF